MAMQKLNVRFSDEVKKDISELAAKLGESDSEVARRAMEYGLFNLNENYRLTALISQIKDGDSHLQEYLLK